MDHWDSCADFQQQAGSRTLSGNQINRQSGQFFREGQDAASIPVGIARGDRQIATLDVRHYGYAHSEANGIGRSNNQFADLHKPMELRCIIAGINVHWRCVGHNLPLPPEFRGDFSTSLTSPVARTSIATA